MARNIIGEEELLRLMNIELQSHEECKHCRFTSIARLNRVDETGCNWSHANLDCSGLPVRPCMRIADHVIAHKKQFFNVS